MAAIFIVALCVMGGLFYTTRRHIRLKLRPDQPHFADQPRYTVPLSAQRRHAAPLPSYAAKLTQPQPRPRQANVSFLRKFLNRASHTLPGTGSKLQPQNPIRVGGRRHDHMIQPLKSKPTVIRRIPDQ